MSGQWLYIHNCWVYVLDSSSSPGFKSSSNQAQQHPSWRAHQRQQHQHRQRQQEQHHQNHRRPHHHPHWQQTPLPSPLVDQFGRFNMDNDMFQAGREEMNFIDSPFVYEPVGHLGLPTDDDPLPSPYTEASQADMIAATSSLDSSSASSTTMTSTATASPCPTPLEDPMQNASLVHLKEDEHMHEDHYNWYMDPRTSGPWTTTSLFDQALMFDPNHPQYYYHQQHYLSDNEDPSSGGDSFSENFFLTRGHIEPSLHTQPISPQPWRSIQQETRQLIAGEDPSGAAPDQPATLSPSQLNYAPPPPSPSTPIGSLPTVAADFDLLSSRVVSLDGDDHQHNDGHFNQEEDIQPKVERVTPNIFSPTSLPLPEPLPSTPFEHYFVRSGRPRGRAGRKALPRGRLHRRHTRPAAPDPTPASPLVQDPYQRTIHPKATTPNTNATITSTPFASNSNSENGSNNNGGASRRISPAPAGSLVRQARDDWILRGRAAGLSYRELKEKGGLPEAESTLRGRYRTLTKNKEERVRKPIWTDFDIVLLRDAVERVAYQTSRGTLRVCWTNVSMYMEDNGGSYPFGITACRKKWDEVGGGNF